MNNRTITLESKFDNLELYLKDDISLNIEKLGGEIPFFVFTYIPSETNLVDKGIDNLIKKLSNADKKVLLIDLFELSIEILQSKKLLQAVLNSESTTDKVTFLNRLRNPLDVNNIIAPEIAKRIRQNSVDALLIKGVGSIFPIFRSHLLLNNLQGIIKDIPMIMFFPGRYNNFSLELFGKLKDENYYRAFNLDNFQF